jgi:Domain of Unknown Function (DUF1080)
MQVICLVATLLFAPTTVSGEQAPQRLTFEKAKVGQLPPGWKAGVTGKADGSVWKVVEDKTAPGGTLALAQTSANPSAIFNLCVAEDGKYKDVDITVAFKAVAGKGDQGGGILWRCQDNDNYYIVRMNPLEDNFRFYKVEGGKRKELVSKDDIKAESGKWHTIRVVHKGKKIQCYLNGKLLIDTEDDTFQQAGKIGLWTKADAQTYFADLQITAKKE